MKIDVKGIVVGAGLGVLDSEMEAWDARTGRAGTFKTATDISRAAAVVVGYGAQIFMPRYTDLGEKLAQSALPLLTKSVYAAVKGAVTNTTSASRRASFQARSVRAVTPSNASYQLV